ncbi:MAG: AAA family ATPase [Rothia sp. (in: high G+C Gram-positive bacteria)]|uniref:McrB family protein n=1 Tax=Rothia sp. (in: high G+C Gram-positive bacteria) TaxID=1885016 RepID=UPI0026FF6486|nr:AAA family ATPase [Rothia sp. (in: high G+C Gram-positive bacteria)]
MFGILIRASFNDDLKKLEELGKLKITLARDGYGDRFLRIPNNGPQKESLTLLRSKILGDFETWKSHLGKIPVLMTGEFMTQSDETDPSGLGSSVIPYSEKTGHVEVLVGNIVIHSYNLEEHSFTFDFVKSDDYLPMKISDIVKRYAEIFGDYMGGWYFNQTHFAVHQNDISDFLKGFKIFNRCAFGKMGNEPNIIVEGVAGSGKSHMLQELRESGVYGENGSRIEVVVFHPSTSYEEFVSGIRPNFMKKEGEGDFVSQEGIFVQVCNRAAQDPDNTYLLFIDEINRANTARVFGDLMLVLEKSKRQEFKDLPQEGRSGALFEAAHQNMPGDYVRLQTPIFKNGKEYNKLAVPTNLHVLGTMNTTDRSVGTIDLALRRRFHWITQEPMNDRDELLTVLERSGDKDKTVGLVADWFIHANEVLGSKVGPDARLGHAYFFGKDGDAKAIAEALLNQLKEVAFTFNISQTILDEIGPVYGQKIIIRGTGLGTRPDIVDGSYQG